MAPRPVVLRGCHEPPSLAAQAITQPSKCRPSLSHRDGSLVFTSPRGPWHLFTLSSFSCVLASDILLAGRSQTIVIPLGEKLRHRDVQKQGMYAHRMDVHRMDVTGPLLHGIL